VLTLFFVVYDFSCERVFLLHQLVPTPLAKQKRVDNPTQHCVANTKMQQVLYHHNDSLYSIEHERMIKERKTFFITKTMLMNLMSVPQAKAAAELGISVATLKRKCKDWNISWPKSKRQRIQQITTQTRFKMSIDYILNASNAETTTTVDKVTQQWLHMAFQLRRP